MNLDEDCELMALYRRRGYEVIIEIEEYDLFILYMNDIVVNLLFG